MSPCLRTKTSIKSLENVPIKSRYQKQEAKGERGREWGGMMKKGAAGGYVRECPGLSTCSHEVAWQIPLVLPWWDAETDHKPDKKAQKKTDDLCNSAFAHELKGNCVDLPTLNRFLRRATPESVDGRAVPNGRKKREKKKKGSVSVVLVILVLKESDRSLWKKEKGGRINT
jgi:hypothetical protein